MICATKESTKHLNIYVKLLLFVALSLNGQLMVSAGSHTVANKENTVKPLISLPEQNLAGKAVISPDKFSGEIAAGYRAAQKARFICSKLFCYCGCDLTDEHLSLLDCFTSMHGVDCAICQEEAIIALRMKEQGKSLGAIQKAIDERYAAQYPWDDLSPALQRYLNTVQVYQKPGDNIFAKKPSTKDNTSPKPAPRKKRGGHCCGH